MAVYGVCEHRSFTRSCIELPLAAAQEHVDACAALLYAPVYVIRKAYAHARVCCHVCVVRVTMRFGCFHDVSASVCLQVCSAVTNATLLLTLPPTIVAPYVRTMICVGVAIRRGLSKQVLSRTLPHTPCSKPSHPIHHNVSVGREQSIKNFTSMYLVFPFNN